MKWSLPVLVTISSVWRVFGLLLTIPVAEDIADQEMFEYQLEDLPAELIVYVESTQKIEKHKGCGGGCHRRPDDALDILRDAFPGCLIYGSRPPRRYRSSSSCSSSSSSHPCGCPSYSSSSCDAFLNPRPDCCRPLPCQTPCGQQCRKPRIRSSSSSSSSLHQQIAGGCGQCGRIRIQQPRSSTSSSSSSSCSDYIPTSSSSSRHCRKPQFCCTSSSSGRPQFRKPARPHRRQACSVSSSSSSLEPCSSSVSSLVPSEEAPCEICPKDKALEISKTLLRKIQYYLNNKRFQDAWPLIYPSASFYIMRLCTGNVCKYEFGSIKQLFPAYVTTQTMSSIRGYHYFNDGSVALHTIDLVSQGGINKAQYEMYYYFSATHGCDLRLSYVTGRNLKCKKCCLKLVTQGK